MLRLIKLFVSLLVWAWGAFWSVFTPGRSKPSCVVLYYHAVPDRQRKRFADQMDCLLRHAKPVFASLQTPLPPGHRYAAVTFDDGFVSVIENALQEMKSRGIPATIFVPSGSLGTHPLWVMNPSAPAASETVLSSGELKALANMPLLEIGSHTVTHPNLVKIEESRAYWELVESKNSLETILGIPVNLFSFPHGAYNEVIVKQARQAGYQRVFTISPTPALLDPSEFVVGRTLADPSDWSIEFTLKLMGAYRWLPAISVIKAKLLCRSGANRVSEGAPAHSTQP